MTTATATIVFTDVAGSTELRTRVGEAAADRLFLEHERLTETVVTRHRGRVLKKAGDGLMAAFDSASDAVAAAVDIQRSVARRGEGIALRVGIAAGDVSWEDGDCLGLPVVVASRLEAAAEGGQILVSQVVRWLAGERSGAQFDSVGPLELKGLAEPVEGFTVAWQLTDDELASQDCVPLPSQLAHQGGPTFVGRDRELHELEAAWRDVLDGGRRVVLLGGEPGAGKTRLASEFARAAQAEGAAVLFGACDAQLLLPYQPWVQVLDHLLRTLPPDQLDPDVATHLAVLHPLLPRLERRSATNLPTTPFTDTDGERYRLFSAVDGLLAEAARRWPVVVLIDDVQWGGPQTLALLSYLARSGTTGPMLVMATFRDVGDEAGAPLTSLLADLRRVDRVRRLRVEGLDERSVASLVEATTGHELDQDLRVLTTDLTRRSRGNAFFVGELWRHLVTSGAVVKIRSRWEVRGSLDAVGVPDSVREVVADRLARLEFPVRRLAELVAIAGPRVELDVLRAAVDVAEADVTARLDELVAAGLLEAVTRPRLTYQFTHAIVRDTVEAGVPAGARAQLHLRVAEALELVHEHERGSVLSELARHYDEAAGLGVGGKAVYYCRRAAEQAMQSAASDEAVVLAETALLHTAPGSVGRAEVLLTLGEAEYKLGHYERSRAVMTEAFEIGRQQRDGRIVAEAAIGFESALQTPGLPGEPAVSMVRDAIALLGDDGSSLRARLEAALAEALHLSGQKDEARATLDVALGMARKADDAAMIVALEAGIIMSDDPNEVLGWGEQLEEVARRNGDTWGRLYVTVNELRAYVALGDLEQARAVMARHRPMADRFWAILGKLETCSFDHILALAEGDFAASEVAAEEGFEVAAATQPAAAGVYGLQMFAVRREQGRLDEVAGVLEAVSRQADGGGAWRPGLAMLYAEVGMLDDARRQFDALAADGFASLPRDAVWPATVSFLADACIALRDERAATILYDEMRPMAGKTLQVALTTCLGPADRLLGGLAALLGRDGDADAHFAAAVELAQRAGSPVWRARAQHDWAAVLVSRGEVARAEPMLTLAMAAADEVGMVALAASCRAIGAMRPRLIVLPDASAWPGGLSGREVDVLRLVAKGRSNREIGEELNISANTAANHVRSILQKTSCANRTEAAAYAARHELV